MVFLPSPEVKGYDVYQQQIISLVLADDEDI